MRNPVEHSGFLSRLASDTGGNTLALAAAAIIPLTMMVGSGLDLSVAYMSRTKLQNACDAGVLAARQHMTGTTFNQSVQDEAKRFFDFNFPHTSGDMQNTQFSVTQNAQDKGELLGTASAEVPTSLMRAFGFQKLDISVTCDATKDMGHNDVVLVLDVTGSMNCPPGTAGGCGGVEQTGSKIGRLRTGARGLYRALDADDGSKTRYGIVPYSHTVNIARSLKNRDFLVDQSYVDGEWSYRECDTDGSTYWNCEWKTAAQRPLTGVDGTKYRDNRSFTDNGDKTVHISNSYWNNAHGYLAGNRQGFRTSGMGCIEERPSLASADAFTILTTITQADVDTAAANGNDTARQFGRYDPFVQRGFSQDGCPSESTRLTAYVDEASFGAAVTTATANVTGGTYHDIGMLWGARFASRTGFFSGNNYNQGDNVTDIDGVPVNTHIVFMTDGKLDTGSTLYSAYGVETYQGRLGTSGTQDSRHIDRFHSVCDVAKGMGITIWVIALDVSDTDDIEQCATSDEHFYTSDGTDLEQIFTAIGQGIGNLRLTR
ncbi:Tad domain-containing protein [Paraurantiacibacter namhicola]|uniref:Putative Flp pilus-assembly TadG-like N-terminal domain-containing protein n=1 Tax=Paraurantiacibacter namhicola TaxID=645517 RepID=A0A1C7D6Y5_9SPHN|nr:TadE/TadG family type IV pilus assembly protein [Paraurantiacibacter namhicola]ANU07081.1 hypothetical protein A6F65_00761 [Paraurantiacibacter namhicola]